MAFIIKRKQIKNFAKSIGMCNRCFLHESEKNSTACQKCLERARKRTANRRGNPNNCKICGKEKTGEDIKFDICLACRNNKEIDKPRISSYMSKYYKEVRKPKAEKEKRDAEKKKREMGRIDRLKGFLE